MERASLKATVWLTCVVRWRVCVCVCVLGVNFHKQVVVCGTEEGRCPYTIMMLLEKGGALF